jgi:hypothetical protein
MPDDEQVCWVRRCVERAGRSLVHQMMWWILQRSKWVAHPGIAQLRYRPSQGSPLVSGPAQTACARSRSAQAGQDRLAGGLDVAVAAGGRDSDCPLGHRSGPLAVIAPVAVGEER